MRATRSLIVIALAGLATAIAESRKQRYQITLPKTTLDKAIASFGNELDVWKVSSVGDGKVKADIYVTDSTIAKLDTITQSKASTSFTGKSGSIKVTSKADVMIERNAVNTAAFLAESSEENTACTASTLGWLEKLPSENKYVDSAFFDCWRQPDEVFSFLDTLVKENPTLISKIDKVTTTYENRTVPGYKISTGSTGRKSIYTQALIHAREWHAGSTGYYTIATFLDGLRSGDATVKGIFDEYDWYFVPILNLDGHLYSWSTDRYWRKNRRPLLTNYTDSEGEVVDVYGVDLNRNYGPEEFFNRAGSVEVNQTYSGKSVLSEPETAGSFAFVSSLPNLRGAIDLHSYGGMILRPFGNQVSEPPAPYGPKIKALGDGMRDAMMSDTGATYISIPGVELYPSYGTFRDSVFMVLNNTASFTIEMEGEDFVVPESAIRPGAKAVVQGLIQFAKDLSVYNPAPLDPVNANPGNTNPGNGSQPSGVASIPVLSLFTILAMVMVWALDF